MFWGLRSGYLWASFYLVQLHYHMMLHLSDLKNIRKWLISENDSYQKMTQYQKRNREYWGLWGVWQHMPLQMEATPQLQSLLTFRNKVLGFPNLPALQEIQKYVWSLSISKTQYFSTLIFGPSGGRGWGGGVGGSHNWYTSSIPEFWTN